MLRKRLGWLFALVAAVGLCAGPAAAWGELGHRVSAAIAYHRLTPRARQRIDQLLRQGRDNLAEPDFVSAATWADRDQFVERATASWHFASFPVNGASAFDACPRNRSPKQDLVPTANDCIVAKLGDFSDQLAGPAPDARSLRFLIHLVGDLHQPLHVADNGDRGGNCVRVVNPADVADSNLHVFWDTDVVEDLVASSAATAVRLGRPVVAADDIAARIERTITPAQAEAWVRGARGAPARGPSGWPALWARESVDVAARQAYAPLPIRGCGKVVLTPAYAANAGSVAADQLAKSGVRLAFLLNQLFDR